MALIACPECGQQISDKAKVCIHCGFPIKEKSQAEAVKQTEEKQSAVIIEEKNTENDKEQIVKGLLEETEEEREFREANNNSFLTILFTMASIFLTISMTGLFVGIIVYMSSGSDFLCLCGAVASIISAIIMLIVTLIKISRETASFKLCGDKYMEYIYPRLATYKTLWENRLKISSKDEQIFLKRLGGMVDCVFINQAPEEKKKQYIKHISMFIFGIIMFVAIPFVLRAISMDIFQDSENGTTITLMVVLILVTIIFMVLSRNQKSVEKRKSDWIDATLEKVKTEEIACVTYSSSYLPSVTSVGFETTGSSLGLSANGSAPSVPAGKKQKNKVTAILLCIFLGQFGVHRFYEGKIGTGLLYLFTFGLFWVGEIVDLIRLIGKPNPYYV